MLRITGLYREWDRKSQSFTGTDAAEKNKLLRLEKLRYLKIAEKWEYQGKDWIPVELSHYYDDDPRIRNRYITVSETIDTMAERTAARKRYKNGLILTSEPTARKYRYLKTSLDGLPKINTTGISRNITSGTLRSSSCSIIRFGHRFTAESKETTAASEKSFRNCGRSASMPKKPVLQCQSECVSSSAGKTKTMPCHT